MRTRERNTGDRQTESMCKASNAKAPNPAQAIMQTCHFIFGLPSIGPAYWSATMDFFFELKYLPCSTSISHVYYGMADEREPLPNNRLAQVRPYGYRYHSSFARDFLNNIC
jgi:hypothetical protein